jgi:hypothetical protein
MGDAPAELWVRPWAGGWYETQFREEPAAVRYVRADLYEALGDCRSQGRGSERPPAPEGPQPRDDAPTPPVGP